jgi:hypothetical protein
MLFAGYYHPDQSDTLPDTSAHLWVAFHYGYSMNTATQVNSWLMENGYPQMKNHTAEFGFTETGFEKNWYGSWGFDFAENFASSVEPVNVSMQFGAGIKIAEHQQLKIYAGLQAGLLNTSVNFNNATPSPLKNYDLPSRSYLTHNSLLLTPNILLMRRLSDKNLKKKSFFSTYTGGIEAGYHIDALYGRWQYGYTIGKTFHGVTVPGIPNAGLNGFYALLKLGWFARRT